MKTTSILFFAIVVLFTSCKNKNSNNETTLNSTKTKDDRVQNSVSAKKPKGKMSFDVDGKTETIDENQVQCMYIGMGNNMAQSVISGGSQCTIIHVGMPKIGNIEIDSIGTMPSVGIQVIIDGIQYNNKKASDTKLAITKITPDGKNYYVAGTFSGILTSIDNSKKINVSNGTFESAYL